MLKFIPLIIALYIFILLSAITLTFLFCKKRSLKVTLVVLFSLFTLYAAILLIDLSKVNNLKSPVFAREVETSWINMKKYKGFGYEVEELHQLDGKISSTQMHMAKKIIGGAVK